MTLADHLMELRRRVILALVGLTVATALCGIFYEELLTFLIRPYEQAYEKMVKPESPPVAPEVSPEDRDLEHRLEAVERQLGLNASAGEPAKVPPPRLIQGGPLNAYTVLLTLCIVMGVTLASPWILYQLWAFVGVGLHPHERRFVYTYGPSSLLLFLGGSAAFYWLLLPLFLRALMSPMADIVINGRQMVDTSFLLTDYFNFVAVMALVCGLIFETPLVVLFLARTGLVSLSTLARQQKLVILIMTIVAAVLTPTIDPFSMTVVAVPLILLYEIGLLLAWLAERSSRRRQAKEAAEEMGG
jgi:sec-independent protein translocase protein TatC